MTKEQYDEFVELFGHVLIDPEHNPEQFKFYIRLYKHMMEFKNDYGSRSEETL